jgi:hypothetical protein
LTNDNVLRHHVPSFVSQHLVFPSIVPAKVHRCSSRPPSVSIKIQPARKAICPA